MERGEEGRKGKREGVERGQRRVSTHCWLRGSAKGWVCTNGTLTALKRLF